VQVVSVGGNGTLSGVADVEIGDCQTCARIPAGTVHCWGYNFFGQLGNGTTTQSTTPVQVVGPGCIGFLNLGIG
jgi:alpha-tubulin suppressor-like RCC1 family protein